METVEYQGIKMTITADNTIVGIGKFTTKELDNMLCDPSITMRLSNLIHKEIAQREVANLQSKGA